MSARHPARTVSDVRSGLRAGFRTGVRAGLAAVAAAALVVGCGRGDGGPTPTAPGGVPTTTAASTTGPGGSPSATGTSSDRPPGTVPPPRTSSPASGSALVQLAPFLDAVGRADDDLRATAVLVNRGFRSDAVVLAPATVAAVRDLDTSGVARLVPAGAPTPVLRSALGLVAGLTSRERAFVRVLEYADPSPLDRTSVEARDLLRCLANGSAPARAFRGDVAALRRLAAATPAFVVRPASSRAAADVAVRAAYARGRNEGCGECGGYAPRPMPLVPLRWTASTSAESGRSWDGTVDGVPFRARYTAKAGWSVELNAC